MKIKPLFYERYITVYDSFYDNLILRVDQAPWPLWVPPRGMGVVNVLTRREAEQIFPRAEADCKFAEHRAKWPNAQQIHLDYRVPTELAA